MAGGIEWDKKEVRVFDMPQHRLAVGVSRDRIA
jgi:hypothetical protein